MSLETDLIKQLDESMLNIYKIAKKECNYNPTRFLEMLNKNGSLHTAQYLINASNVSAGFTKLWECGRLDLSVEAVILQEPLCKLFTEEELKKARNRLKQYNYVV